MTKKEKDRQRVLNGGRGGGEAYRRLFEYYENKVYSLNEQITELKAQIEKMKCCVVSCCEGCERLPKLYKEFDK